MSAVPPKTYVVRQGFAIDGAFSSKRVLHRLTLPHALRKSFTAWTTLILLVAGLVAPVQAADPDEYTLGAGDRIKVTVFDQPDLSGSFKVDGTGLISLPLIGKVKAGGKTVRETENTIIRKLKPDFLKHPRVAVEGF